MLSIGRLTILRISRSINPLEFTTLANGFHNSSTTYLNQNWRQSKGYTRNPNSSGPLVDLPDYTFKDGRPTPYGSRQKNRIDKQREYAERIVKLVGEIDYAVERHSRLQEEEKQRRQRILNNKLKPKGKLLIEQNNTS